MSTVTSPASVDRELAAIVGSGNVRRTDFEINGVVPAAVVYPGSADEVGAILHLANARDLVVAPAGGLTKQQIGCVPERIDILLSTTRLNKVEEYDPGDLTIAVQAGMPFAEMQRQLGEHQQWVPCDASSLEHATVGGLLATGAAGPLKSTFGHMRDFCIGIQFVTADGKVVKGGGRVVKNVAGYDLMKLLTGSYGSLALITRANFKDSPATPDKNFCVLIPLAGRSVAIPHAAFSVAADAHVHGNHFAGSFRVFAEPGNCARS